MKETQGRYLVEKEISSIEKKERKKERKKESVLKRKKERKKERKKGVEKKEKKKEIWIPKKWMKKNERKMKGKIGLSKNNRAVNNITQIKTSPIISAPPHALFLHFFAHSAGAVEYTNCTSAEG